MKRQKIFYAMTIVIVAIVSISAARIPYIKDYVRFNDNLYAQCHEVTNKEYREFLMDLKTNNQTDKYNKCLYDSIQWVRKFTGSYTEPFQISYHSHPAYDNYPIVNITPGAAKSYCEWLTAKYNSEVKRKYKKVTFRLPDENEWKKLASPQAENNLPWKGNSNLSEDGKTYCSNIKVKDPKTNEDNYVVDGGLTALIVSHYKPNDLGIYDVIGNVCEMTQEGKQKGGSWDNYLEECKVDKTQNFSLPDPRVGFRVVMEIIEE